MVSTFELGLAGPVPGAVAKLIRDRFGEVVVRHRSGRTVLEGRIADRLRSARSWTWRGTWGARSSCFEWRPTPQQAPKHERVSRGPGTGVMPRPGKACQNVVR